MSDPIEVRILDKLEEITHLLEKIGGVMVKHLDNLDDELIEANGTLDVIKNLVSNLNND